MRFRATENECGLGEEAETVFCAAGISKGDVKEADGERRKENGDTISYGSITSDVEFGGVQLVAGDLQGADAGSEHGVGFRGHHIGISSRSIEIFVWA